MRAAADNAQAASGALHAGCLPLLPRAAPRRTLPANLCACACPRPFAAAAWREGQLTCQAHSPRQRGRAHSPRRWCARWPQPGRTRATGVRPGASPLAAAGAVATRLAIRYSCSYQRRRGPSAGDRRIVRRRLACKSDRVRLLATPDRARRAAASGAVACGILIVSLSLQQCGLHSFF